MKALTLRGFSDDLAEALESCAKRGGTSLNATVMSILRQSLGLTEHKFHTEYHDMDHLSGTWSKEDQEMFDRNTSFFSDVDKELWS